MQKDLTTKIYRQLQALLSFRWGKFVDVEESWMLHQVPKEYQEWAVFGIYIALETCSEIRYQFDDGFVYRIEWLDVMNFHGRSDLDMVLSINRSAETILVEFDMRTILHESLV